MLGDRVPRARIGLANGVFYAGIPVGFALSFALAGVWARGCTARAAGFLLLGAAGLVAVPLVWRMSTPPGAGPGPVSALAGLAAAVRAVSTSPRLSA